ncbi:MAG: phage major capsid protein [Burkholderiales bacterium]|nr:phage major capsid protein [Burkholderiales bacterium]
MTPTIHEARRQIAEVLAHHYAEAASSLDRDPPRFSLARLLADMAGGPRADYERETVDAAQLAHGGTWHGDPHRAVIPWSALSQRTMATTPGSKGGYLAGVDVGAASQALRPWSVTARAGVTFLENLKADVALPLVPTEPTGNWLPGTVSDSDPTLGSVSLAQRTFVAVTPFSLQLLRQSAIAESTIRAMLLRAAGRALDAAVLNGAGGAEPLGLLNSGLPSASGTSFALASATGILKTLGDAGLDDGRASWIASPAARKLLQERVKATGTARFIWDDDKILNRAAYATSDMPSAAMVCGDFSHVLVGLFGAGLRVDVNPNQSFNTGSGAARVVLECDVCVNAPAAFVTVAAVT